jgi:hypothetical protein
MRGDFPLEHYLQRTRRAEVVLYLDFDGVLHTEHVYRHPTRGIYIPQDLAPGRTLFEWASFLEGALAPYPDVKVVLSTSWVRVLRFKRALEYLPDGLRSRVIGATFHSQVHGATSIERQRFEELPRGLQVLADVKRRRPAAWLAVDDDAEDWPEAYRANLVECKGPVGLSDAATLSQLKAKLADIAQQSLTPHR